MGAKLQPLTKNLPTPLVSLAKFVRPDAFAAHMRAEAIRPQRNVVIAISIVAVFALFGAYEFARMAQDEAEKQALISKITAMQASLSGDSAPLIGNLPSVDEAALFSLTQQDVSSARLVPHFLVLGSMLLVVLLLVWQRRGLQSVAPGIVNPDAQIEQVKAQLREEQREMSQKLLEEKFRAEAASRAKTSFLAHLSHDVRTPLNHIIGFADLIVHQTYGPLGDNRYVSYINDIKNSGERLLSSFTEILELAQIEGGQLALRREQIAVTNVMQATADRFQEPAQQAGIRFELSLPSEAELYGDRICLERMLGNILQNSIQFTPAGGRVRFAGWIADDGVVIEISDTGIGMSEERLKDLSQPFVLGDAAFTRKTSGVGLGIAISRAIAELSGGMMEIDSNPAIGTTVAISLPLKVAQSGEDSQAA